MMIYIYIYIYIYMIKISGKMYKSNTYNGFNSNISFFIQGKNIFRLKVCSEIERQKPQTAASDESTGIRRSKRQ